MSEERMAANLELTRRWLKHLKSVVGLASVPRDQWSDEDRAILKEARDLIAELEEEVAQGDRIKEVVSGRQSDSGPVGGLNIVG